MKASPIPAARLPAPRGKSAIHLCPICGYVEDGEALTAVKGAKAKGAVPGGRLTVFLSAAEAESRFLTVAFESGGYLVQPKSEVTLTIPAELLEGFDLVLIGPDGAETPVEYEAGDEEISFILNFMPEDGPVQVMILKLIPKE